nr:uncharacterized protein LOC107279220 [Oryza sativa Japonica Group]
MSGKTAPAGTEPTVNKPNGQDSFVGHRTDVTNNPQHKEDAGKVPASSEELWRTPSDPFELELAQLQYERPEDDPDYIPIKQAMATRRRSKRSAVRVEPDSDTATSGSPQTDTTTSGEACPKKKRGEKGRNLLPKETYYIAALDDDGKPVEPEHVRAKFSTACGALARLHGPLNVDEWKHVSIHIKNLMWEGLQEHLIYPPGSESIGRKFALQTIAHRWRQWKSDMDTNYIQKNKTPFEECGNISAAEWDKFVAKMTTPQALERRKKLLDLAKKKHISTQVRVKWIRRSREEMASYGGKVCGRRQTFDCAAHK